MAVELTIITKCKQFTRTFNTLKEAVEDAINLLNNDTGFPMEIKVNGKAVWVFVIPRGDFEEVITSLNRLLDINNDGNVVVIY